MKSFLGKSALVLALISIPSCNHDIWWHMAWDRWYVLLVENPSGIPFNAILDLFPEDDDITEGSQFECYSLDSKSNTIEVAFYEDQKWTKVIKDSAHIYILDPEMATIELFKNHEVTRERIEKLPSESIIARMTIYNNQIKRGGTAIITYPPIEGDGTHVDYYSSEH